MLDFQLVQAPFRLGVDEGTDPKQVPFGTLLTAENVVWEKSGQLRKRQGTTTLTTSIVGGGTLSSASRLFTRGRELLLTEGTRIYGYTSSGWVNRGRTPEVGLEWYTSLNTSSGVMCSDVAYLTNGNVVQAWVSGDPTDHSPGGVVFYQVFERTTGAIVVPPTQISGSGHVATRVRVVSSGNNYVILWIRSGNLDCFPSGGSRTNLKSTAGVSFDACTIGSEFVVAFSLFSGGIQLSRYSFAAPPVEQTTVSVSGTTSLSYHSISVDGASGETLYVGYVDFNASKVGYCMANPSTLAQTVAPTDLASGTSVSKGWVAVHRVSSSGMVIAYSVYRTGGNERFSEFYSTYVSSGGVAEADGKKSSSMRLVSRPFTLGGRQYAFVSTYTDLTNLQQGSQIVGTDVFLADITVTSTATVPLLIRLAGKVELLTGGTWYLGSVSNVPVVSSSEVITTTPYATEGRTNAEPWQQGSRLVTVTIGSSVPDGMWKSVEVGPEACWGAGVFTVYDGADALPYSFSHPAWIDADDSAGSSAGGAMAAGSYIYAIVPERKSAAGVLHRGPQNVPQTMTVASGTAGSVQLYIAPILISVPMDTNETASGVRQDQLLALYRSVKDGSVVQRLTLDPTYNVLLNPTASLNFGFLDTKGDSDIGAGSIVPLSSRPLMYTEGGELDDMQPPALYSPVMYRGRIFAIDGSGREVWFTKSWSSNPGVAPGFNPLLRFSFDESLTALSVMDERLFFFSERSISYVAGDGPAPNGDGSDYGEPSKVQTDVGCTNPRGIVSTPAGIMFIAGDQRPAIYILTRGLQVVWKGAPVQDLLRSYPVVTSAVLVADHMHVRFTCNALDGLSGIVIVYDYAEDQWSHFRYGASVPIADACMHDGAYTFVTTSGVVYKESADTNLDNGSYVVSTLETAWVHASGPLSYQSVRNFQIDGECVEAHGLSISVGFDGTASYQQGPRSWAADVAGVTAPGLQRAKVSIGTRRKCGSIRFKIQDSAPVTLGEGIGTGARWSSMGIEVGMKRGPRRLPATQAK